MALHSSRYQLQLFIPAASPRCIPRPLPPPTSLVLAPVFPKWPKSGWSGAERDWKVYWSAKAATGLLPRPGLAGEAAKAWLSFGGPVSNPTERAFELGLEGVPRF